MTDALKNITCAMWESAEAEVEKLEAENERLRAACHTALIAIQRLDAENQRLDDETKRLRAGLIRTSTITGLALEADDDA